MIPKLAIIIPYYKIDFFEETLQSVVAQTDKRFTLYIGNDASPNDPKNLIEKHFPDGNYKYYNYKENVGGKNLALQWERILENVTEEWFQILGDDDMIAENFVEEFYKALPEVDEARINLIKTGLLWIDDHNEIIENNVYDFKQISAQEIFLKKYKGEIRSSLSENIYKTRLAKKYKFTKLPLAWGSDDMSLLRFSENGMIHYIAKPLVLVRVSQQSISGSTKLSTEKEDAYMHFKENLFTNYTSYLPKDFLVSEIMQFVNLCYLKGYVLPYSFAQYFFKLGKIKLGVKTLKKIYYIHKKHGS